MADQKNTDSLLPAYLITGDDELKRETVLKRLHARVSALGDISFNFDSFEGEAASGDEIVAACNTIPFASDVRLVQVNNVEKLKKADSEPLVTYLAEPASTTVLALVSSGLAKNTRLYKAVAALGKTAVIDCSAQRRSDLPKTIRSLAVGHQVTISDAAAQKLVDLVGENTIRLDAEIKKLALACGNDTTISPAQVESLVTKTSEPKPWEFVDAFAARDSKRCVTLWQHMDSTSPHALIAMCVARIRELICMKSLEARGAGNTLATILKVPSWRVKNHSYWAKGFSAGELRSALAHAMEAERAMKSGSDPDTVFIDWTLHITTK